MFIHYLLLHRIVNVVTEKSVTIFRFLITPIIKAVIIVIMEGGMKVGISG